MQVIFETQDIAKATSDNMVTLMGLMQSIAKRVMDEPAEQQEAPKAELVKEPEPKVEELQAEAEAEPEPEPEPQPEPPVKKTRAKKHAAKKDEPVKEVKADEEATAPADAEKTSVSDVEEEKKADTETEKAEAPAEEKPEPVKEDPPKEEAARETIDRQTVINLGKSLVKKGLSKQVTALMHEAYGVKKFSDIKDEQLADVYAEMKGIEKEAEDA